MNREAESRTIRLKRLANGRNPQPKGTGIQSDDLIPLCRYHNRAIAAKLIERLTANGIATTTETTRMYVSIFVAFEKRQVSHQVLEEFNESNVDTLPREFSRDYDAAILVGFVTIFLAVISLNVSVFNIFAPVAIVTTGASLCVVIERWHRQYRYHVGKHFTVAEMFWLLTMVALNLALWRIAL